MFKFYWVCTKGQWDFIPVLRLSFERVNREVMAFSLEVMWLKWWTAVEFYPKGGPNV